MSHEITVIDGNAEAFYANEPAWHGLGTVVNGTKTSEEAIKLARLDWEVEQRPAVFISENDNPIETGKMVNVRSDIQKALGVVGPGYRPVQNWEAFAFLDSLVHDGHLEYESAGSLKGGSDVWMLAKFPGDFYVTDDDPSRDYILLYNTHDGSKTLQIIPTSIRVVCWNTLSYALSKATEAYKTRHTINVMERTDKAMEQLGIMNHSRQKMQEIMRNLAQMDVNSEYVDTFMDKIFPKPNPDPKSVMAESIIKRWVDKRSVVRENFESVDVTDATRNTRYGLLQAITRYADHSMKTRGSDELDRTENQFRSIFFGTANELKQDALSYLVK